ncbi:MAG: TIGR02679 family protein [Actinomycetota bacterium]|jgi:uncharacterized protein (TIGR02679 family)|nr:TIGR02679 family protein [Actinomycetota bacterium]
MSALWVAARRRLDRGGSTVRATVARPALDQAGMLALTSLLGRPPAVRVRLDELEAALVRRAFGADLDDALTRLGHPPGAEAIRRRERAARRTDAHAALAQCVGVWPEVWATDWAEEVRRRGLVGDLDAPAVVGLVGDVRRLLDHVPAGDAGRTELAARLYGSAHALDAGTRRAALIVLALRQVVGPLDGRELWEAAGIVPDRVSAPALTWRLPTVGSSPLDRQVQAATEGGLPVHVSLLALRRHPLTVPTAAPVFVVENPRLVEAAVERLLAVCVIAGNGNPSTAVTELVSQLRRGGADLRYHGDFDAPGLAICARMHTAGVRPWRITAADYAAALARAEAAGLELDVDTRECVDTPWDPELADAFRTDGRIVHEELLADELLAAMATAAS